MQSVKEQLNRSVDGASLAFFRFACGLTFAAYFLSYLSADWVTYFYVTPEFHFKYFGFEWVRPLPGNGMQTLFVGLIVPSVCVAVGFLYRLNACVLAVGYTYIFLLDKSQYQNHYYLMMLTTWVLLILPANRTFAIDALLFRGSKGIVPAWAVWLARFQVGLPYFFGGIAKMNWDWVQGQPMRMKLANSTWYPVIGPWFTEEWCVQIFVWGGLLLDLLIVPALLWHRTRVPAYFAALSFHLLNSTLFNIGVFPWFMIFATPIFLNPSWPRSFLPVSRVPSVTDSPQHVRLQPLAIVAVLYVAIQVALPWRHFLYPGNVSWTEEGHFFAWHMKLRDKKSVCKFKWRNPKTQQTGYVNVFQYITPEQAAHATGDPEMIVQFCRFLANELKEAGNGDCHVYALTLTSLNGRKPEFLVNSTVNLAGVPRALFLPKNVLTQSTEPLRPFEPWSVPRRDWIHHIPIPNADFWFGGGEPSSADSPPATVDPSQTEAGPANRKLAQSEDSDPTENRL